MLVDNEAGEASISEEIGEKEHQVGFPALFENVTVNLVSLNLLILFKQLVCKLIVYERCIILSQTF